MADGLNHARAMRVAEIMNDFRNSQYHIANLQANPSAEDYYLEGYAWLRQCIAEAQALLNQAYGHAPQDPDGDAETEKSLLKLIIIDASVRRFQCQRVYMRALVCGKWAYDRGIILHGESPNTSNTPQLTANDAQFRANFAAVTDAHVFETLRNADAAEGKYLGDDPSLEELLQQLHLRGAS